MIKSPNYPQSYPHNLVTAPCQWTVSSGSGARVQCNFTDFDTEADYDVVTVCDGQFCCPSSVVVVLSGTSRSPPPYMSSGNSLTLQMTTDGIINHRGFSASCYSSGNAPTNTISTAPPPSLPLTTPTTITMPVPPPNTGIDITGIVKSFFPLVSILV